MVICVMISVIVLLGCIGQNSNTIKVEKYSERQDGNRSISVYKTPDNRISVAVFKNHHPSDFSSMGLTNEIKRIVSNPRSSDWNKALKSERIDGHLSVSTMIYQVGGESRMRTNNIPDLYATAIAYPEKDIVLLITSNGYSANWTVQNEMVNKFKL
jgi:hypothetical protein